MDHYRKLIYLVKVKNGPVKCNNVKKNTVGDLAQLERSALLHWLNLFHLKESRVVPACNSTGKIGTGHIIKRPICLNFLNLYRILKRNFYVHSTPYYRRRLN
jgi:hypothetical protein